MPKASKGPPPSTKANDPHPSGTEKNLQPSEDEGSRRLPRVSILDHLAGGDVAGHLGAGTSVGFARSTKSEYLVGEPIVVLLEIKNVGDDLVAYGGGCDSDVKMAWPAKVRERLHDMVVRLE